MRFTRETPELEFGLSPRGAVDLVAAARCWAMINGHAGVHPEDLKAIFAPVAGHRLQSLSDGQHAEADIAGFILESVPVP